MASLRTPTTEKIYHDLIAAGHLEKCPLCRIEPIKQFVYWKVIPNEYPYDLIAETHHMVVPLRHVAEAELTEEEKKELYQIKNSYINEHYEYVLEATHKQKSVPAHFHLHLMVIKEGIT